MARQFSKEHKERLSTALRAYHQRPDAIKSATRFKKGFTPWNKGTKGIVQGYWTGKKRDLETRKKVSAGHMGKKLSPAAVEHIRKRRGEKHPRWIKDRSLLKISDRRNDSMYKEWRKKVRNACEHKCVFDGEDCSGRLEAHHIFPWSSYPEKRYDARNGVLVCRFHHPRGRKQEELSIPSFLEVTKQLAYD